MFSMCSSFYCGERQVNRKMLSPVSEKHREMQKVIPGWDLEGGTRPHHLGN